MRKQLNKRNKQKKTQGNSNGKTSKYRQNRKKKSKEKHGKQTMRMTTARRKPIACQPEIDAEDGVENTSRGDARKDWQWTVGGKAGAEEIGGVLRTREKSLSETLRANPTQGAKQPTNQTNKIGKTTAGQRLGRRGTEEVEHKRRKRAEEKRVKHCTKGREHQVNCLAQRVEDKEGRGGSEGQPSSHLRGAHRDGARVYWERKGLQLSSTSLYTLEPMYDFFIANSLKYIIFNLRNKTNIYH